MKKINIDFSKMNFYKTAQQIRLLSLLIIIITLSLFVLFLYRHVHNTLSYAEIVTELKQQVTEESIDTAKFDIILDNINNKTKVPKVTTSSPAINNPFIKRF